MSEKQFYVLAHEAARQRAHNGIDLAPKGWEVVIKPATRNSEQNARMWAQLGDVARQVDWYGKRLTPEDWKHVFSSALKKMDVVPNLDGTGFVALGLSTSRMSKRELSDLMELINAFGAERGVEWSEHERIAT